MKIKTISIDAEGLDLGYEVMIRAALDYVKDHVNMNLRIYLLEDHMEGASAILGRKYDNRITLLACKAAAGADIESRVILHNLYETIKQPETRPDYTMVCAIHDVYTGQAHGTLLPGHTGHIVFIARALERAFGHLDPDKPQCLVSHLPTTGRKEKLMIDLGGVVTQDLYKLAILGCDFARQALKLDEPKVGFLNIGTEYSKGKLEIREAAVKYASDYPKNVYGQSGYIEPDQIYMDNACDVIIADGFTGNCVLKASEGTYRFVTSLIRSSVKKSFIAHLLALPIKHILKKVNDRINLDKYSTAIVLGLTKLVVKCHGSSKEKTLYQSIVNMGQYIDRMK